VAWRAQELRKPRALTALRRVARQALDRRGWEIRRRSDDQSGMEPEFLELHARCSACTMTSIERMYALYEAVRHVVVRAGVPGDFVECGVWRGGSSI
jgi:O-methyltransferase